MSPLLAISEKGVKQPKKRSGLSAVSQETLICAVPVNGLGLDAATVNDVRRGAVGIFL